MVPPARRRRPHLIGGVVAAVLSAATVTMSTGTTGPTTSGTAGGAAPGSTTGGPDTPSGGPVPSGRPHLRGHLRDGSVVQAVGPSWNPPPCTPSATCSVPVTVTYRWSSCAASSCRPVAPPVTQPLVSSYELGPSEVGRRLRVDETATELRADGSAATRTVSVTAPGPVAPWPLHQAPLADLRGGTPPPTTASNQERFWISPPHANPSDGPVRVTCSLDDGPSNNSCGTSLRFETPPLVPGTHRLRIVAANSAGSRTTEVDWTVVPLPAPVPCTGCFHPPAVAGDGQPPTWDWQLSDANGSLVLRRVDMLDIDGFDNSAATVARIHARAGSTLPSERAICYLDLGAWEEYRPDAGDYPPAVLGRPLAGWPQERWVDVRQVAALAPVVDARLQMCAAKGFDGVEIDDIDGWAQGGATGFPLTAGDARNWLATVANQAHRLGMFVLWKNEPVLAGWAVPYFDGALSEQCYQYRECTPQENAGTPGCHLPGHPCGVSLFQQAGKWVGEIEYDGVCPPGEACQGRRSFATFCAHVWQEPPTGDGFAAARASRALDGSLWQPCWQ